jgi:uncharacterized protein
MSPYLSEVKDPAKFREFLKSHPELTIVQDVDRSDEMGAVGIERCFAYNAKNSMASARVLFSDRLEKIESMVKTRAGKEIAEVGAKRLRIFRRWWNEEVSNAG